MDEGSLILIVLLFLFSAFMTLAYAALNNMRPAQLEEMAENGSSRARDALALINRKSHLMITYQLCMALSQSLITVILVFTLFEPLMMSYGAAVGLAAAAVTVVVALIITQVVPEGVGSAYARQLYPWLTPALSWIVWLLMPVTWLLIGVSRLLAGLFGGAELVNTVTEEEILTLVNAGEFEEDEKDMIYSVLQLDQRDARQLMVPRMDIVAIEVNASLEEAADKFISSGFSRIPVYENVIDNIVGVVYAKDLLRVMRNEGRHTTSLRDLARTPFFVPETLRADDLLQTMQKRNVHMAIVVDEYGGTSGLVTIENLIEEIIGDIRDEYDQNEEVEYTALSDHEYLMAASMNIADINELLDLKIEDGQDYDTIGGFIFSELGRLPHVGDTIDRETFTVTVRSIEGRRIRQVYLTKKVLEAPEEARAISEARQAAAPAPQEAENALPGEDESSGVAVQSVG